MSLTKTEKSLTSEAAMDILSLYAAYNRAIDAGDADAWVKTFVADGVFAHPARTWRGSEELRQFIAERTAKIAQGDIQDQRHWNDAFSLELSSQGVAGGCDLLVSGADRNDGRAMVVARGRYEDVLSHTHEGWLFVARRLTVR